MTREKNEELKMEECVKVRGAHEEKHRLRKWRRGKDSKRGL